MSSQGSRRSTRSAANGDLASSPSVRASPSARSTASRSARSPSARSPSVRSNARSPTSSHATSPSARAGAARTPTTPTGTPRSRASTRASPRGEPFRSPSSALNSSQQETDPQIASGGGSQQRRSSQRLLLSDPIDLSGPLNYGSSEPSVEPKRTFRRRTDIVSDMSKKRQIQIGDEVGAGGDSSQPGVIGSQGSQGSAAPHAVIWGTDVVFEVCKEKFKRFLKFADFVPESDELEPRVEPEEDQSAPADKPLYLKKLEEILALEDPFLNVNCHHLHEFDINLYQQLVAYPQEVIPAFDIGANELFFELYPDANLPHQINVRPYNVVKTSSLRSLNPENINQLITISGLVIRTSNLIPEMIQAFFECSICLNSVMVEVDHGRISEPTVCTNCNNNFCFRLIHNRSVFIDKQQVKLQESPDDMPAGQTPYTVLLYSCSDLVDAVQPGDRVTVTGVYRATPVRVNPKQRAVKSVYRTHVDVVHYRKLDAKRLHDEAKACTFSPKRVDELKTLSRLPDIYDRLAYALAPSIYEHDDVKKGILLQLFGGTKKEQLMGQAKARHFRAEMNILLCGDPGTSKSQLLQYVFHLVPRGQYTSGKGSSAVGLTAYITRDPDTRQLVLQTGALVLSDGGICCIDEFDKMSEGTRSVLHEVMEQQTLSIAKAGIVCQLNARTSILAAANPIESQWNKNKTIIENIQLPPTLLSRFDLIFLLLDPQDEAYDRRLAQHLVSLYHRSREEEQSEVLDHTLLKDYISYARNYVHPKLSEEAAQTLIQAYVEMRKIGAGKGQISAYPRQLESLIRLSEAHAKMRLAPIVELSDVEEARRLHREAIKQAAIDPTSGRIDISILTTGVSSTGRKVRAQMAHGLKSLLEGMKSEKSSSQGQIQLNYMTVFNDFKSNNPDQHITRDMFDEAARELQDEGYCILVGNRYIRLTS